ncbi:ATP phosphoribosyltransferase (ATP-PRTase) (ATP-PRT) [Friedmanniomyces endolithicus]|uniref:ATP phosphoribosyltransferase n=1 Tax=Friedmanniomyces endolithicus TaxID=329885 RepID=A0AAN6KRA0_9PEZI|nr:ATP phosphoribosyltransferase (ATP-PRTase) (ATP-PRT) [Friedmanniomyces endolithicus]KAK0282845.1 ATP phosphoribosyltransferase (ATP-PRTase) (ATP-PRT) [Friedmanniomyces endolithicus]KAK0297101.1 ATP phosphoribosyltransferase (ATP-PRTase) (ATP-PRT) [Friedmanniomyces endolithicus]KAK0315816.1 ATP phosphoribosyltransferase (ATP-PRTase) (ATP-PRT) [Friedmanniomyces endolithicus]KAK0833734.1 ATP phosphoribosyltransferase (ATP-PRTase) (ATP-PRT) [Friedmanniomyces endolithicus]
MSALEQLNGKLLFAIPKKGRLKEKALSLLDGSDVQFNRSDRSDIAFSNNTPVALVFLPASDIPAFVGRGKGALGITGSDCILEYESKEPPTATSGVEQILDLGFGRCKLQVQVPEKGEVERPEQLVGKTIATSFDGLSRKYFRELERKVGGGGQVNGSAEGGEGKLETNILHLSGSVEAAYSLGMADAVVDLVESGLTMRVAGLKPIATVLESSAVLIRSKHPSDPKWVDLLTDRIRGVITAQRYVLCTYNVERRLLDQVHKITPGKRAPTINNLEEEGWVAVQAMVESDRAAVAMDELKAAGAQDILIIKLENTRV